MHEYAVVFGLEWKDIVMIIAVIVGPIAAIWISRKLEDRRAEMNRRFYVYRQLMATRSDISQNHVDALNLVEVDFYKDKSVIEAFRLYRDHLKVTKILEGDEQTRWDEKRLDLLADLLHEISISLKTEVPLSEIRKGSYVPHRHASHEENYIAVYELLRSVLEQKRGIPIFAHIMPANDQDNK